MVLGARLGNAGSPGYLRSHRFGSFLRLSILFSLSLIVSHEKYLATDFERRE
jgi:hypothetical protein